MQSVHVRVWVYIHTYVDGAASLCHLLGKAASQLSSHTFSLYIYTHTHHHTTSESSIPAVQLSCSCWDVLVQSLRMYMCVCVCVRSLHSMDIE